MLTEVVPTGQGVLVASSLRGGTVNRTFPCGVECYGTLPPTGYDAPTGAWVNAVSPDTT